MAAATKRRPPAAEEDTGRTGLDRHVHAYRALLRLYPCRFRAAYGREMVQVFRDALRRERAGGRHGRVLAFWAWVIADMARTAARERAAALRREDPYEVRWFEGGRSMGRYVIRRLLFSIPVLIVGSVLVFVVIHVTQDPLKALLSNPRFSVKDYKRLKGQLGLDRSGVAQYFAWLSHFLRGDWGVSIISQRSVSKDIGQAMANSAVLGLFGTGLALLIGMGVGLYSSIRQYSVFDHVTTTGSFLGLSIPNFWFAIMLQVFFGLYIVRWFRLTGPFFPVAGITTPGSSGFHLVDHIRHLVLPSLVLAVQIIAIYSRYMRASMLEVMHSDYLRTARAKGLRERRVIARHAMRNALIPITTQLAIDVGLIASGLIITEQIFQYPGMGFFFITAMHNGDYPQILPWMMITVSFVIIFNLVADVMYAVLDPRIRYA